MMTEVEFLGESFKCFLHYIFHHFTTVKFAYKYMNNFFLPGKAKLWLRLTANRNKNRNTLILIGLFLSWNA